MKLATVGVPATENTATVRLTKTALQSPQQHSANYNNNNNNSPNDTSSCNNSLENKLHTCKKGINKMTLNCDTFIKEELLTAEEKEHINNNAHLNISIKNEPILDEAFPSVTVKNEHISEVQHLVESVIIKTENSLQTPDIESQANDRFLIYELDTTPADHIQPAKVLNTSNKIFTRTNEEALINNTKSLNTNLNRTNLLNTKSNSLAVSKLAVSPPILLNSQLRKRRKIILPVNPIDKRARYNIERRTQPLLNKQHVASDSTENSRVCRLLNTGNKKIINHLIKPKRKQRNPAENPELVSTPVIRENSQNQEAEFTTAITIKQSPSSPTPLSTDSPIIPELRVKCLCSLTDKNTQDISELKVFFKEMFEETRRLNKAQQRKVKMSLLKAISDAEESVEQGKCCDF